MQSSIRTGKGRLSLLFLAALTFLPAWVLAQEEDGTKEQILAVFYPYKQGMPQVAGISPGMTIDKTNFQVAQDVVNRQDVSRREL